MARHNDEPRQDWSGVAGRTLMVGLPAGPLQAITAERLQALGVSGVILFARNLQTPSQLIELVVDVVALFDYPLLISIDQEGGQVSRLEKWIGSTPTARQLAQAGPASAFRFGRLTGEALTALGLNWDFAPVVDLSEDDADNGIGTRSFSTDPQQVIELAGGFLDGLQQSGVAGCLKHFPGLGCTVVDSHDTLPTVQRSPEELETLDLLPYRALAQRAASVMVGHGSYPCWTPDAPCPASGSPSIIRGLLRHRLDYRGLVVSDDLEMGAVTSLDGHGEYAVQAIDAGCDLLLYCHDLGRAERAQAALTAAANGRPRFQARLQEAAATVARFATHWPSQQPQLAQFQEAQQALRQFAQTEDS